MLLPKRHGAVDSYRYGFQGQEKDDEIKGEGNSVNYKFRMHDPRLGRFFAVDPLTKKYPHYSPYSFSGNKVIFARELEGLEEFITITDVRDKDFPVIHIKTYQEVFGDSENTKGLLGDGIASYRIKPNGEAEFVNMIDSESDLDNIKSLNLYKSTLQLKNKPLVDVYGVTLNYLKQSSENGTTESGKYAGKIYKGLDRITKGIDIATDLGKIINGNPVTQAETVASAPIKYTAGAVPGLGAFIDYIIEDGKDPNGLTNLRNGLMARAYGNTERNANAYVYKSITRNYNPNNVYHDKIKKARDNLRDLERIIEIGTSGEEHIENYFNENDCFENCNN
jgi:RHS repeat-associated protein